jgi:protein transport protein SEC9
MKKFGFGKKGEGDEDSNRSALFGSRKNKAPANPGANPYAQQPTGADPYAQEDNKYANMGHVGPSGPSPYQQAKQQYTSPAGGLPSGPGPNRYGTPPAVNRAPAANGGGYGADKYGSGGGYGSNRYDIQSAVS